VLNKSWKARRSAADGPSGCAHLVSPAPPAGTVLPSPEAGPWSIDRLDSRYPSPQTVELCSTRARSSVIYNGGAKHVFSWTRFRANHFPNRKQTEPNRRKYQQQIAYVPRLKYAIGNLGSQTQGECPIKAPDILRQPVMLLHVAKQKAVLAPRKPKKLRCQKKHRNFEAGFGVNTGASRRIARHTRTHWRAHESSDPSRASHRRIVVRKRPLNVRNSHVPFGKRSRISPERRRESSLVSRKKTREAHGPRRGSDPRARPVISDLPGGRLFANVSRGTSH